MRKRVGEVERIAVGVLPISKSRTRIRWPGPVIQIVCVAVVWAWSRVFMRLIEEATHRGIAQWPPRKGAIGEIVSGRQPVLASTRFGRVMFWLTVAAMFCVLLVFAFWGLFIY